MCCLGKILGKMNLLGVPFYLDNSLQAHAIIVHAITTAIVIGKSGIALHPKSRVTPCKDLRHGGLSSRYAEEVKMSHPSYVVVSQEFTQRRVWRCKKKFLVPLRFLLHTPLYPLLPRRRHHFRPARHRRPQLRHPIRPPSDTLNKRLPRSPTTPVLNRIRIKHIPVLLSIGALEECIVPRPVRTVSRGEEWFWKFRPAFRNKRVRARGKQDGAQGVVLRVATRGREEDKVVCATRGSETGRPFVDGPAVGFHSRVGQRGEKMGRWW